MADLKYRSEFALSVCGDFARLIQQDDLEQLDSSKEFNEETPCHIYMICRRPRISYNPKAFRLVKEHISGEIRAQIGDQFIKLPFVLENNQGKPRLTVECPYPHTEAIFRDEESRGVRIKAAYIAGYNHKLMGGFRDNLTLEVLYIGQSYGVEGARTAPERLRKHSTLQGIYAEAIAKSPDKDIWLLLWSFKSELITIIDGRAKDVTATEAEDDAHVKTVLAHPITDQLEINLAEAALIRYFQPDYNNHYKNTFPNPAQMTYSECYDLDLNTINVEVCTDALGSPLKSAKVPAHWRHHATYPLHSAQERRAMFDWSR